MRLALVPLLDEGLHLLNQFAGRGETPVSKHATTHDGEPQLDLIQPRPVGRRIVKNKSIAMLSIPLADEGSCTRVPMRVQIVQDDVHSFLSIGGRHQLQKR